MSAALRLMRPFALIADGVWLVRASQPSYPRWGLVLAIACSVLVLSAAITDALRSESQR